MRCKRIFVRLAAVLTSAFVVAGFTRGPVAIPLTSFQTVQAGEPQTNPQAPVATSPEQTPAPAIEPERPLTPEEQKAADARLQFDRALVDAAVLLTDFENYKRGRSKTPVSMSAFRNLEIQLNAIADADPSNDQARDWAKKMQQAQFEILQPSVAVADAASRQLFADKMSEKLSDQGIAVSVLGPGARILVFVSRQMTKETGAKFAESTKIYDQARGMQFEKVVFANGRRGWMYDLKSNRYR